MFIVLGKSYRKIDGFTYLVSEVGLPWNIIISSHLVFIEFLIVFITLEKYSIFGVSLKIKTFVDIVIVYKYISFYNCISVFKLFWELLKASKITFLKCGRAYIMFDAVSLMFV